MYALAKARGVGAASIAYEELEELMTAKEVKTANENIVDWQPPLLTFKACFGATLACNAGPHQTDRGIADVALGVLRQSPILDTV